MTAVIPAFHWLTSLRSTTIPNSSGSLFQNIYTQATSGTPVINDSLSAQSATSWDTYHEADGGGCAFIDRALRCKSPLGTYGPSPALSNKFSNLANLAIEVSATIIQGDRADVLLRWHGDTESGYRFYFTNDGRYTFEYLDRGDEHVLVSQSSSTINTGTGQTNIITIIAHKDSFYLYINAKYVNSVNDSFLSSGQIAVASDGKSTDSEVAFSNVRVWQL